MGSQHRWPCWLFWQPVISILLVVIKFCSVLFLTFDLLTLKVVSESHVTWATSLPIFVFLRLSVLDLGPMYATDRQTSDVRRASSLNAPYPRGGGTIIKMFY